MAGHGAGQRPDGDPQGKGSAGSACLAGGAKFRLAFHEVALMGRIVRPIMIGCLVAAALSSVGCHAMRPVTLDQLNGLRPAQIRVTNGAQEVVVIDGPQVVEGRLVGWVDGEYRVIPAAEVKQVLMRTPARGRTIGLVAAGVIGAAAVTFMVAGGGANSDPCRDASSECEAGTADQ